MEGWCNGSISNIVFLGRTHLWQIVSLDKSYIFNWRVVFVLFIGIKKVAISLLIAD